jgi:glycine cleavage system aminomethyltransferase T
MGSLEYLALMWAGVFVSNIIAERTRMTSVVWFLVLGVVTSGGYGPSVNGPIAMGYVPAEHASTGSRLNLLIRGKPQAACVVSLPFVSHRYFR